MKRPRIKVKTKVKSKLELESVKIVDNVDNGTKKKKKKKKAEIVKCEHCEKNIPKKDLEAHLTKKHKDVIDKQNINKNLAPSAVKRKAKTVAVKISPKEVIQSLNPLGKIEHYNRYKTKWEEEFLQISNYLQKNDKLSKINFATLLGLLNNQILKNQADKIKSADILIEILYIYHDFFELDGASYPNYALARDLFEKYYVEKIKQEPEFKYSQHKVWNEIFTDIDHEIFIANKNKERVEIEIVETTQIKGVYLYVSKIISEVKDDLTLPEGVRVHFKSINSDEGGMGTVLNVNEDNGKLYFQSSSRFSKGKYIASYSTAWLIEFLRNNLFEASTISSINKGKIWNILNNETFDNTFKEKLIFSGNHKLNDSQLQAISHCLNNKITFIWGPPGTGKSTTLGHLCKYFFEKGEKTLVTTIANVAIDSVLLKSLEVIERDNTNLSDLEGKVLRIGKTYSQEVLNKQYLYSINEQINILRESIKSKTEEIEELSKDKTKNEEEIVILKSEREQAIHDLKNKLKTIYNFAHLIFSTSSYTLIDNLIKEMDFDNVIIDEISMMNIPFLLWLSKFSKKRIIVAGDFRQLGPIASSRKIGGYNWMKKDVFQILDNEYNFAKFDFVQMLMEQHRMNAGISAIINEDFYENKLQNKGDWKTNKCLPFQGNNVIKIIDTKGKAHFQITGGGSRINEKNQKVVIQILDQFTKSFNEPSSVGIITPYRAQAKALIKALENYKTHHTIKIGTIHAFQGSEADMIIIDFVESEHNTKDENGKISRLFFGQDGERLINVAVSRAKSKIVIIGDLKHIKTSAMNMTTSKFKNVINKLLNHSENV